VRVKLTTTLRWPIERQIPQRWRHDGIEFVINQPTPACDAWVVYQGMHRPETTMVPPNRLYFFGYEPPGLHRYQQRFLEQFAAVVTCQAVTHDRVISRHQAQPWLAGVTRNRTDNVHQGFGYRFGYDQLAEMSRPDKPRTLSAVCSNKQVIPGHADRLDFVNALRGRLGEEFALFGYGFCPLEDKWDAMRDYQYHLVLENSCVKHYWTEKLADAYLAWCVPIVWGCPNLADYFPTESYVSIDPQDLPTAVGQVLEATSTPPTASQIDAVAEARRRVLEDYNLFAEIRRLIDNTPAAEAKRVRLRDERLFMPGGWLRPFTRALTDRWRAFE
jgi:hypothetical protein